MNVRPMRWMSFMPSLRASTLLARWSPAVRSINCCQLAGAKGSSRSLCPNLKMKQIVCRMPEHRMRGAVGEYASLCTSMTPKTNLY